MFNQSERQAEPPVRVRSSRQRSLEHGVNAALLTHSRSGRLEQPRSAVSAAAEGK
jgi:hypothetical protein